MYGRVEPVMSKRFNDSVKIWFWLKVSLHDHDLYLKSDFDINARNYCKKLEKVATDQMGFKTSNVG